MKKIISIKYFVYDLVKLLTVPLGILWFRPKIYRVNERVPKRIKGGAILISNHISFFDPVFLQVGLWNRRHHFLTLSELFNTKFKKWLFNSFLCIPVDRNNFSIDVFRTIVDHLKSDDLVTMFPEGHINHEDNSIASFKSGMILMAMKSGKPIIPIFIKKRKTLFSRLKFVMGEPLYVTDTNLKDINKLNELLHEREVELKNYFTVK